MWPPEWRDKYKDPVVKLNLALYGHPDSVGHWEKHCNAALNKAGFVKVAPWRSTFWHDRLKLLLVVYVDDFKMSGPKTNLSEGWKAIRKGIVTDDPKPVNKCLGCQHDVKTINKGGIDTTTVEYNMEDFLKQCVSSYLELAKLKEGDLNPVKTPFLDDSKFSDKDDIPGQGTLKDIAARVLMKILYCARLARFDLLKAISNLATKVTRWSKNCDRMLHQLVCYIQSTLKYRLTGVIGDKLKDVSLELFSDADFAGDKADSKSTSGVFLALKGPNTFFPLSACSKKQSCVSHSTPEAELVAANLAVRTEGLPALDLWGTVTGRDITLDFKEDNQAAIQIIKNGRNPTLRHVNRTHRVNADWLTEVFRNDKQIKLVYCKTVDMAADIFTKAFHNAVKWLPALSNINMIDTGPLNLIKTSSVKNIVKQ